MKNAGENKGVRKERSANSELNSMFTNIQIMAKKNDDRYDSRFVYYCISRLNAMFGQSKRFIMCKLLESGLNRDELYSPYLGQLRKEFEQLSEK